MRRLKERLNKKGFTLAELLIVVAIIAVLVAISVPVFNSKLEKSREATDIANMRAAKAAAVAAYLNGEIGDLTADIYYDAEAGTIVTGDIPTAYGQGTAIKGGTSYLNYTETTVAKDCAIKINITGETGDSDIKIEMSWVKE
ncbi:prepilin-type N-terminal cleavage/methylation domain-containing protein [Clostridium sp. MCC353]|uniref:type II secretion system protein n=1 Tax=Clostridium sp. MCC353 TaxID=2592646 RepID=UPI001C03830E|nr:prepilin-type N-terminal cleavage/methylation domain-containing protein [Clostridium sp. MCC353]MBT9779175.1 prepilin-type N-terminal cleavage/methylation domain-containing protein [Clostridium sp. MCC353]